MAPLLEAPGSSYKQDPNNTKRQIPIGTPAGIARYSHATCPADAAINKPPSYVVINAPGTYAFAYESGSVDHAAGTTYVTGSTLVDDNGPIKLDINPTAWRQTNTAGSVGDVTFVYVRVR